MASQAHMMVKIDKKKFSVKPFPHFDPRIPLNEKVWKRLHNRSYISSHSFYPFIHYKKITRKYSKKNKRLSEPKIRNIYYASHMDGYIYKYYGEKLNEKYSQYCLDHNIDNVSLAYRNNKKGKSNIHFAAEVIEFISKQEEAFIFITDFTKYFDNLDHDLLKKRLLNVLNMKTKKLPSDWWKVFKSLTRFSWVDKKEIIDDLKTIKNKKNGKIDRYYTPPEFRAFRKRVKINKHEQPFGIPQGTAISAVLANVYAIKLDQELNEYASKYGGLYRRYSDDIILVFPIKKGRIVQRQHISYIISTVTRNKVQMGDEKTKTLYSRNGEIYEDANCEVRGKLDYLGFCFDGTNVMIREKSLYKYYHRMYKKIKAVKIAEYNSNRKIGRRKLYLLYSHLGRKYKGYGNFITYAEKAHRIFGRSERINSLINRQIKRHWKKIYNRLNQPGI